MHEAKCTHTDMKPENVLFRYKHNYDTVFNGRKRRNENDSIIQKLFSSARY